MAKEITTVRLDPELIRRLDAVAEARGESRSVVIERVLRNEVADEEDFVNEMEHPVMRALVRMIIASPAATRFVIWLAGGTTDEAELRRRIETLRKQIKLGEARHQRRRNRDIAEGRTATE